MVHEAIAAVTDDGAYEAVYASRERNLESGTCGLRKAGTKDLLVQARCTAADSTDDSNEVLPFERWQWTNATPDVRRLKTFDESGIEKLARIGRDWDTRVDYVEVFHGGSWIRVRFFEVDDCNDPKITGVIKGRDRYLVRLQYNHGLDSLDYWDAIWAPTFAEVADERGRYERAHKQAQDDTARMREHRKQGDAVFAPPPSGTKKEKWEQRRRHGIARFLRKWEIAAVLRPLSAADLKDTLWLLAWLDSPRRRYESLRLCDGVRSRDPKGAAAVVDELTRDPDTRALADYLKTTKDWLRGLPMAGEEMTPAMLRGLSSEQLLWLRRSIQVRAGYRLDDPVVRQYFEGMEWYSPMSDRAWKKLTSDPAWTKDPDAVLLRALDKDERGKHNLMLIKQADAGRAGAELGLGELLRGEGRFGAGPAGARPIGGGWLGHGQHRRRVLSERAPTVLSMSEPPPSDRPRAGRPSSEPDPLPEGARPGQAPRPRGPHRPDAQARDRGVARDLRARVRRDRHRRLDGRDVVRDPAARRPPRPSHRRPGRAGRRPTRPVPTSRHPRRRLELVVGTTSSSGDATSSSRRSDHVVG